MRGGPAVKNNIVEKVKEYVVVLMLLAVIVVFSIATPNFLQVKNLFNIARQVSMLGIVAACASFAMISGAMDLAVGSVVSFACVLTAELTVNTNMSIPLACMIAVAASAALGMINGLIAVGLGVAPIIITLGTMTAYKGIAYLICGGISIYGTPDAFRMLGQGYLFGIIPIPVIILISVVVIVAFILNKTVFGRAVFALGGNDEAARLAGIKVKKVRALLFAISGFGAGLAGVIMCSRLSSGVPNSGNGYEFDVVTACVIGGVSPNGGEGKISGVLCGVLVIGVLNNGLTLMNINEFYQNIVNGVVLILAITFDVFQQRQKLKSDKKKVNAVRIGA